MSRALILIGLLIVVISTLVVQATVVLYSDNAIITGDYWLGFDNIKMIIIGGCLVFPFHFLLIFSMFKKKKVELHWAIPLAIMPYMIGVTIYGLVF
jgi:hypothetical protein